LQARAQRIAIPRRVSVFTMTLGLLGLSLSLLGQPLVFRAEAQASGNVTVTGTNTAKITIEISDSTAAYGVSLAPDGSGAAGEISSVTSSTGSEGAYYIWTPSSLPVVRVKSNKTWNGTMAASENAGTSTSMTIASGVLRWSTSAPGSYAEAASATAFTTGAAAWQTNHAKGVATYSHYYALRVDWTDDPGAFASTVTYAVSQ